MIEENDVWRNLAEPYYLAEKAEAVLGNDPRLAELFSKISLNIDVITDPPGANVYLKEYSMLYKFPKVLGSRARHLS